MRREYKSWQQCMQPKTVGRCKVHARDILLPLDNLNIIIAIISHELKIGTILIVLTKL